MNRNRLDKIEIFVESRSNREANKMCMGYLGFLASLAFSFAVLQCCFGQDTYDARTGKSDYENRDIAKEGLTSVANVEASEIGSRLLLFQGTDFSLATAFPSGRSGTVQKVDLASLSIHEVVRKTIRTAVRSIEETWELQRKEAFELHDQKAKISDERFQRFFAKVNKTCLDFEETLAKEFVDVADPLERDEIVKQMLRLSLNFLKSPFVCEHLKIGRPNQNRISDHFRNMKAETLALLENVQKKGNVFSALDMDEIKLKRTAIGKACLMRVCADLSDPQIDIIMRMAKEGETLESFRLAMSESERKIFDEERKWIQVQPIVR